MVNADDLGYSKWRDEGIFRAFHKGIVTSATLLVNGASASSAARRAVKEGLDIGLHLNLTEGVPLTPLEQIPTLVGEKSKLRYKVEFWKNCTRDDTATFHQHVAVETRAQLHEFKRLTGGIPATHIDGHQHVHVAPGLAAILAPIFASEGVLSTRIPDENVQALTWMPVRTLERWESRIESSRMSRIVYAQHGIYAPDRFLGQGWSGSNSTVPRVLGCIRRQLHLCRHRGAATDGGQILSHDVEWLPTAECMVHPGGSLEGENRPNDVIGGCGDGEVDEFALSPDRQRECSLLCDPLLASKLSSHEHRLKLCSWSELHAYNRIRGSSGGNGASGGNGGSGGSGDNSKTRVLLLAIGMEASGNHVTAMRIRQSLADQCNFHVTMVDASEATSASVLETVQRNNIQIVFGLHAYYAGKLLFGNENQDNGKAVAFSSSSSPFPLPVILIAGGTDLNEDAMTTKERKDIVRRSIRSADSVILFNTALRDRCCSLIELPPHRKDKDEKSGSVLSSRRPVLRVIPQAVDVSRRSSPWLRALLGLQHDDILLLLPSGIRPVKDPLFFVPPFQAWRENMQQEGVGSKPRVLLVLMGVVRDQALMDQLRNFVNERLVDGGEEDAGILLDALTHSVVYHPPVSHQHLLAAISESNIVLNTSVQEGMANVLLEAMALETPVLARRNEGNCSLVGKSNERGCLFTTQKECLDIIQHHCSGGASEKEENSLSSVRVRTASDFIRAVHSCESEAEAYGNIVRQSLSSRA